MNASVELSRLRIPVGNLRSEVPMEYDPELKAIWAYMQPKGVHCFSLTLMREIRKQDALLEKHPGFIEHNDEELPVDFYIGGSRVPDIYSYGGDLSLFLTFIRARDEAALRAYAQRCIDCLWARVTNFGSMSTATVAMVQGTAFGGGWESALASDIIVAEEGAKFSFPEIKFNLFPGMGAMTLLSRRVGVSKAREIITSEDVYTAKEMHAIGLVDILAPHGEAELKVREWIAKTKGSNGLRGILAAERMTAAVKRAELDAIGDLWAATAMRITDHDMRVMNRFLMRQQRATRGPGDASTAHEIRDSSLNPSPSTEPALTV